MSTIVVLDNIRSCYNVGAIFRTADAVGVEKIYLLGSTPAPIDRFGREDTKIAKTSLGATRTVSWEPVGQADEWSTDAGVTLLRDLQAKGYAVQAVEQTPTSVPLASVPVPPLVVYVFGAEVEGVQEALLQTADVIMELPMAGQKESLNVSVTAGIVLYKGVLEKG